VRGEPNSFELFRTAADIRETKGLKKDCARRMQNKTNLFAFYAEPQPMFVEQRGNVFFSAKMCTREASSLSNDA
jgi:hypothetical protein